jgi:putative membrane protein insertion efficiency factor
MRKFLVGLIKLYQKFVHPLANFIGPVNACRYFPTCSNYSIEAIEKHGVTKGVVSAIKRILHCHPLAQGGFDPVA